MRGRKLPKKDGKYKYPKKLKNTMGMVRVERKTLNKGKEEA